MGDTHIGLYDGWVEAIVVYIMMTRSFIHVIEGRAKGKTGRRRIKRVGHRLDFFLWLARFSHSCSGWLGFFFFC